MLPLIKFLLACAVGLVIHLVVILLTGEYGEESRELKASGCHCPRKWWFFTIPSPECPVHGRHMTLSEHEDWNGVPYAVFPTTSVERVPVCQDCLSKYLQEEYLMFYHKRVCGTRHDAEWPKGCLLCERSTLCAMVPKNLVEDWLGGRVFHTRWRDLDDVPGNQ